MVTAAQMLVGTNQPSANGASGGASARAGGDRPGANILRGHGELSLPIGSIAPNAMESFAAALRASVSAQPFAAMNSAAPTIENGQTDQTFGQMNASFAGSSLQETLAALPGAAAHFDENGNLIPGDRSQNSGALLASILSGAMTPDQIAQMRSEMSENSGNLLPGGGFANRIAMLAGLAAGNGATAEPGAANAADSSPTLVQTMQQAHSLGINLGQTPSDPGAPTTPEASTLAALLSQVEAGNIQLPKEARAVLENGGTLSEVRSALVSASLEARGFQIDSAEIQANLNNPENAFTDLEALGLEDLAARLEAMGLGSGSHPGLNQMNGMGVLSQMASTVRAEMAQGLINGGTAGTTDSALNGAQPPVLGGVQQNSSAGLVGHRTTKMAAAAKDPVAATPAQIPAQTTAQKPANAPTISSTLAPASSPPADATAASGLNSPANLVSDGAMSAASASGLEHKNSSVGELINQIRNGEITPDAARQDLIQSGRGNLVERLPASGIGNVADVKAAAINPALAQGKTDGTGAALGTALSGTPVENTVEAKTSNLGIAAQSNAAQPAADTPASHMTAAKEMAATPGAAEMSVKGQTSPATAQTAATEEKSSMNAAFAKLQSGDVPADRPMAAAASAVKTQAELIKENATQFAKSGANPATTANPSVNSAAQPATPNTTAAPAPAALNNASAPAPLAAPTLEQDLAMVQQAARTGVDAPVEPRMAERAPTPAPLPTSPAPTLAPEAAPLQHRPVAVRERSADVRNALRFDTATRAAAVQNMGVALTRFAGQGLSRFQIRLDPAELGRVEVKLDIAANGKTTAHITVERPETLDMMRNDSRSLERALQDAGLKTDQNSMNFSLKDQDGEARQGENPDALPEWANGENSDDKLENEETIQLTASMDETIGGLRIMGARGIDVRI